MWCDSNNDLNIIVDAASALASGSMIPYDRDSNEAVSEEQQSICFKTAVYKTGHMNDVMRL